MELMSPFFGSGRNVIVDNYFTSHQLDVSLLSKSLKLLGTIHHPRKEVPECFKTSLRKTVNSSDFLFDHKHGICLAEYIPKKIEAFFS